MTESRHRKRYFVIGLLLMAALPFALLAVRSAMAKMPDNLGVTNGRLAAVPESPNCVSTQTDSTAHRMPPIPLTTAPEVALARLKAIVESMPRTKIVSSTDTYLHAEFTSRLFRFVDDVEFLVDADQSRIDFRSASRTGYSDLGANRKRMESIREQFTAKP